MAKKRGFWSKLEQWGKTKGFYKVRKDAATRYDIWKIMDDTGEIEGILLKDMNMKVNGKEIQSARKIPRDQIDRYYIDCNEYNFQDEDVRGGGRFDGKYCDIVRCKECGAINCDIENCREEDGVEKLIISGVEVIKERYAGDLGSFDRNQMKKMVGEDEVEKAIKKIKSTRTSTSVGEAEVYDIDDWKDDNLGFLAVEKIGRKENRYIFKCKEGLDDDETPFIKEDMGWVGGNSCFVLECKDCSENSCDTNECETKESNFKIRNPQKITKKKAEKLNATDNGLVGLFEQKIQQL